MRKEINHEKTEIPSYMKDGPIDRFFINILTPILCLASWATILFLIIKG